jgi:hypothetical protein
MRTAHTLSKSSARWRIHLAVATKLVHTEAVPKPGDSIHIPLSEDRAVALLGKVKPTADMPRPGTHATKAKRKKKPAKSKNAQ